MRKKNVNVGVIVVIAVIAMVIISAIGIGVSMISGISSYGGGYVAEGKSLEDLMDNIKYTEADPVKASIDLSDASLYDELPEINKYPLVVESNADVVLEIFSSPEKAGERSDKESWLVEVAEDFNRSGVVTSGGRTCGISVRNVSSGLAADYIISGKYTPALFSPSSSLWGGLIKSSGRTLNMECEKLVGNTAGIMVKKSFGYKDIDSIIEAVIAGNVNLGYTNPQVSSAGMNLLLTVLDKYGNGSLTSQEAIDGFGRFQANIPFVAYNTVQMVKSAGTGSLDCMVSEYQTYTNNSSFTKEYDFIPYGVRHDNPLYSCVNLKADEQECLDAFISYATGSEAQKLATQYGFNGNGNYKDAFSTPDGSIIEQAERIWKSNKDSGREILAVFVADCSGSMDGDPMIQLKGSLTNGMKYINENNYVGLVSYSSSVVKELDIAQFDMNQKSYFQGAVNRLDANGNTHTYEAICLALKMIEDARPAHPNAKCMIFLLSDGQANGTYRISTIHKALEDSQVPVYTIAYGSSADTNELGKLSEVNEAAAISADSDDIIYKIKQLFNAQL